MGQDPERDEGVTMQGERMRSNRKYIKTEGKNTLKCLKKKKADKDKLNEKYSEQSTSNMANVFIKTDTNENLCNNNKPSPLAMI